MRKLLTVVFSVAVLTFCGCAGKTADAKASTSDEPTGEVSTFLRGAYVSVEDTQTKLKDAGFEVVATYKSDADGKTIVFTCPTLKKEAAKPGRSFVAAMRVFVDDKEKQISFTNPVYFGKAYMQDEYIHAKFSAVKGKIETAFPGLKPSVDEKMDFDDLSEYRYTMMNPRFDEQPVLAEGTHDELMKRLKKKKTIFKIELSPTSTLVGYKLGGSTKRFTKKTGRQNGAILPYCIAVSEGKATMLHGEYYIALNYPNLGMITFGTIALIPGAINSDLEKAFKKAKKKK